MADGGTWQPPEPTSSTNPTPAGAGGALPPPAANPSPPTASIPVVPAAGGPGEPGQPVAPVEPAGGGGSGRSRGKIIAAAVGAVAIVGAGVFAISRVAGDSSSGGASSPEAAADAFLDALDDDDVLGLVDVLLPGERETLREPLEQLVGELQRLQVLSDDADLSGLEGIDITITERDVVVQPTNVPDIVNVEITATAQASVTGEELPIGAWIRDTLDQQQLDDIESLDETSDEAEGTFPVTAVRKDGRWYLSAFYSIAESARHDAGDPDIPAEGVALNGGDSPEAAMDNLLEAAASLDLAKVIGSLNPNEFEALQRYAPLVIADAQRELDMVEVALTVTDTSYEVTGSGSTRHLAVNGFSVEVEAEGQRVTFELADGCFLVTTENAADSETFDSCDGIGELGELGDLTATGIDTEQLEELQAIFADVLDDYENPGITVDQVDGRWYVSPLGTYLDQLFALSGALSRDEVEDLVDRLSTFAADVDAGGGFDVPILGMPDYSRPAEGSDVGPTPETVAPDEDGDIVSSAVDACFAEFDAGAAADCFAELVASGDLSADDVPWSLRHPECGATEIVWTGEYYMLPDDEFVAAAAEFAQCYREFVDRGEMPEYVLPFEFTSPQCLEGKNPYNGTPEDLDAFFDCAMG